jgi:hypothetical protein
MFGLWEVTGDQPTLGSSQQGTMLFVVYLVGPIGLTAWWTYLRRRQ